jgi:serine/threonine-protein kinase HipA
MANVFVNRVPVGRLTREDPINRFAYDEHVSPALAVSLLMPISESSYLAERATVLHPVFDMSLPEGPLREALGNMFAKALPIFDDLALLEVVGRSLIGRLRYGPSALDLDKVPPQNLRDLLNHRGTGDLFRELLVRYARYSGVAGVQPKLLIRDDGSLQTTKLSPVETGARITTHGTTHLIKTFDAEKYPGLAANEFLCLQAAKAAGLMVPRVEFSADGRILIVERFDLKPDGQYFAFEDGCAIAGRLSRDKYEGSYEQLAGNLARVLRGPNGLQVELARFFRSLVLSVAVRNGDAHRKNFGVLYDDAMGSVWLAPTYDVVTTTAYIPRDTIALMCDGSKRWPEKKRLERFGVQRCQLTPAGARAIIAEVIDAVAATIKHMDSVVERDPSAAETIQKMRAIWAESIASLHG